jgi:hypothetical protein
MDPAISRDDYRALRGEPRRWHDAIAAIAARHGLGAGPVRPLGGSNLIASVGGTRVVELFPPSLRYQWDSELRIPDWRGRAHSLDELAALVFPLPCDRAGAA